MARGLVSTTCLFMLMCTYMVNHSSAVSSNYLKNFYKALPVKKFIKAVFKKDEKIKLPGRAGSVFLPTGYFDDKCDDGNTPDQGADICFIVQTSCRDSQKAISNAIKDIKYIAKGSDDRCPDVKRCGSYTIVTYAEKATNIGKNLKKIKPGKDCVHCKARTDLALEECEKYFQKKNNNNIPDVIVVFNDGISFDTKQNIAFTRGRTVQKALDIIADQSAAIRVIEYPNSQGDLLDPEDEWQFMRAITPADYASAQTTSLCVLPFSDQALDVPIDKCPEKAGRRKREDTPRPTCPTDSESYSPTSCCKVDTWYRLNPDGTYTTQLIPNGPVMNRGCPNGTTFVISDRNDCGCLHRVDICTGEHHNEAAELRCGQGDLVEIKKVNYGRTDSNVCRTSNLPDSDHANENCKEGVNSLTEVKKQCQTVTGRGKAECVVGPDLVPEFLTNGDPCPETYKYTTVYFECRPDEPVEALCCFADIMLIIDQSNSILPKDVKTMHTFWHDFIEEQKQILHPTALNRNRGLEFGIISYGGNYQFHARLGQYGQVGLMNVIKKMPKTTTMYTSTHLALRAAKDELFSKGRNKTEYESIRKIALVATDGRTWKRNENHVCESRDVSCNDTLQAAKEIRDMGGEVYIIGQPNHKDRNDGYHREWRHMASDPINCTIVNMQNNTPPAIYDDLQYVGIHLTKEFCTQGRNHTCIMPEHD